MKFRIGIGWAQPQRPQGSQQPQWLQQLQGLWRFLWFQRLRQPRDAWDARHARPALLRAGIVAALLLAGCTTPYRSLVADVDAGRWSEPVELTLPNSDTVNAYDWQLFFRCADRPDPDTLTLRITLLTPDSLRYGEPFALQLNPPAAPAAVRRETVVDYRRNVRLTRMGDYRIRIEPLAPVGGIEAVGLQTQPSN